jgi:ADP-heptose:LPS heptosyltransferase
LRRIWPFSKTWGCLAALRAEAFDVVVNCGNWGAVSVTSAIVARLVAPRALVLGPANFPAGWLADLPVTARSDSRSEALQRLHLLSPIVGPKATARLSFRPVSRATGRPPGPYIVINPGGRLGFRRVSPRLFAAAALEAQAFGVTPLITWGPGEEALADEVLALAPRATRAPPTDLDALAALMAEAVATISNNTGPMHLAVAVGSPTLALFLHMDAERWGHASPPHQMLDVTPLADAPAEAEQLVRSATRKFLQGLASSRPMTAVE